MSTILGYLSVGECFWYRGKLYTVRAHGRCRTLCRCGLSMVHLAPTVRVQRHSRYGE